MKPEFVRNPYNYDSDKLSTETGLKCPEKTLTEQEHAAEADINYIADRFMKTGEMPQVLNLPTAGDFEGIFDFQTAMNTIAQAKQEFMSLPAKVRTRFNNDPAELIKFVEDDDNYQEAVKLGFIPPKPVTLRADSTTTETTDETRTTERNQGAPQGRTGNRRAQEATRATESPEKPGRQTAQDD